jgi:protein-S-isoprenylcysteine O-methyltransferase Ste14
MTQGSRVPAGADNPGVVAPPPLIYLGAFLIVLVCRWFWPIPIDAGSRGLWPGLIMIALGAGIAIWGRRTMEAAGTNVNPARPAKTIVSSGPFRFSRNPLYLSLTTIYLGLTLAVNTRWGFVVLIPLLVVMHRSVVLREERYLDRKFGDSYRQYRSNVRRYL